MNIPRVEFIALMNRKSADIHFNEPFDLHSFEIQHLITKTIQRTCPQNPLGFSSQHSHIRRKFADFGSTITSVTPSYEHVLLPDKLISSNSNTTTSASWDFQFSNYSVPIYDNLPKYYRWNFADQKTISSDNFRHRIGRPHQVEISI